MVKLTNEMKEGLVVPGKGGSLIYLATSSLDGKPNIAAMRYIDTYKDDKLLVADMFLLKTKANLKENPECIIAIWHSVKPWIESIVIFRRLRDRNMIFPGFNGVPA